MNASKKKITQNDASQLPLLRGRSTPPKQTHNVMSTIDIPISEFRHAELANIQSIHFGFKPKTQGVLLFDSIEWFKD